jgi:GT2 family glycosyltransferase
MASHTTAVVVARRSRRVIDRTLEALRPAHEAGEVEVVVVDDASRDGTAEHVRREHAWAQLLTSAAHLGFGRACNAGLARARTPYVLFLDSDVVVERDALSRLAAHFEAAPGAGLVAPAVGLPTGGYLPVHPLPSPMRVVAAEGGLDFALAPSLAVWPGGAPLRVDRLGGSVLMGRRELLERVGGFDSRLFLYFEESDLCVRVARAGGEVWLVPRAVASHVSGLGARTVEVALGSGCVPEHYFASRHYYLCKHFGLLPAVGAAIAELAVMTAGAGADLLRGRRPERLLRRLDVPLLGTPRHSPPSLRPAQRVRG